MYLYVYIFIYIYIHIYIYTYPRLSSDSRAGLFDKFDTPRTRSSKWLHLGVASTMVSFQNRVSTTLSTSLCEKESSSWLCCYPPTTDPSKTRKEKKGRNSIESNAYSHRGREQCMSLACTYVLVCIYTYICAYTYICIHTSIFFCMHVDTHIGAYVHICERE